MSTPSIPSATRFLMARIQDLVLDLNLAGRHQAWLYIHGGDRLSYRLVTMPRGCTHTDPEAVGMDAWLSRLWDQDYMQRMGWSWQIAQQTVHADLLNMAERLERLIEEGKPS
ncbi:hypothetical protein [Halomonas nitroreducens]|uniref:Uncharacterized protein n=1 Tax=Halomonas nitroreducens TaxID=447425 RepID=A0A431V1K0_9GAMM|nr:hypothetical protein [Halomonas nitroreducens]RTR01973.1 hypothetical protein EKG36_13270 [Halomonas nitroreducens]